MRRSVRSAGGWCVAICIAGLAPWGCGNADTNPFSEDPSGGQSGTSGSNMGGSMSGSNTGGSATGGASEGGTSGSSAGGDETGGTSTGGSTDDGGAGADAGSDSGGSATGGTGETGGSAGASSGGANTGGGAGMPAGGAGMGGAGMGGAGMAGAGMAGAGMSGSGGMPGDCHDDTDCDGNEYCKKASCDAESGNCTPIGPDCYGDEATFAPVCGCDGTTFFNACVLAHAGMNAASQGECTGNDRPTCTREDGGTTCPSGGDHARCYRPVDVCGDVSPTRGYCWAVPEECSPDEPQTERYCGGTAGGARCIGLCEVLEAENSFNRDSGLCD